MVSSLSASERRAAARTVVVWDMLRPLLDAGPIDVLDIGGGTGVSAVRIAELGHRVTVVDPSPDALAALGRRADEKQVTARITSLQGDLAGLADLVAGSSADLILCHGVLEVVEDPAAALATIAGVLRPGGTLSLLVAQRHAAVLAKAMAGQFHQARALLEDPGASAGARGSRRFDDQEVIALVEQSALRATEIRGVRVFTDLVPGSLLDAEAGAADALVELEQSVSDRPEFRALAAQLHLLATR